MNDTPIQPPSFPKVRGREIRTDADGFVCLNDIWSAAGFKKNQQPTDWKELQITGQLIVALLDHNSGQTGVKNYNPKSVIYSIRGKGGGTYADVRLALAYAEYLNPKLALEVREVFLRYKAADPALADDILERAGPEANEWAGTRALGRSVRNNYTAALQDHGVKGPDFGACTNTLYQTLFDANAKKLREQKNLPAKANVRDAMTTSELVFVMAGETLSTERIHEEGCDGGEACRQATSKSARFIRMAIDADRKDRNNSQPPPANDDADDKAA